ncbi:MAG: hypothetical protein LQ347_002860 [Umbilicaria vellea]|nr:MAG: hypothetical protein LQ347_002860 [Umbilicaria vellea]
MMSPSDPDNPLNWPIHRRIYVSTVAFAFAFVVAFGATCYTVGIPQVVRKFDVSMTNAILGLSLYLLGIAFAPITTPHLSERFGRSAVYLTSLPIFSLFIVGAGVSQNFATLAVCRFFAGFFGGPCLVLIEGPLVGGFLVAAKGWRWTQWVTLMLALAAYLLGLGMPETYQRSIMRQRAVRLGLPPVKLAKAGSGETFREMLQVTLFTPLKMLVTEPIVIGTSLYLGFNFAVVFSFFISVPVVLGATYAFDIQKVGLAFIAAIVGALLACFTSSLIDRLTTPRLLKRRPDSMIDLEHRLYPAMFGGFGILISLFWIGWTASPKFRWASPVLGTFLYVWGNVSVLNSAVPYLFDAYPPAGTLSALTAAASFRLVLAAVLPLVIIQMFQGLTGAWALSTFGFISATMLPLPWILFIWGSTLRARSPYNREMVALEDHASARMDSKKQSTGGMASGVQAV